ncbi:hypothetical protein [Pseudooctadecabacter jejudonensis]|uniref:Uncharacterized protein n=1 Tax=Pseudooctadecabacter jejudonensis TaxID=1391910 RepID=A0A1Y5RH23_9RHOB|nr:hypothetical protein [Pseudooctadecabacter jejudonensis]SLN17176.1 hypothetical protein PSJ8397_00512 [Pseudooctadecabacter jejudonensis]
MAVSKTTFAERMAKIESGNTTSWTVPGEGLAEVRDERRFLAKAGVKMRQKSTQKKAGMVLYVAALVSGVASVILGRWLDFRFLDDALALAADKGVDLASMIADVPTSFILALVLSLVLMLVLGLRKTAIPVQTAGFLGALVFEGDLVALAPEVYAKFYPPNWVADMMASAALVT